MYLPLTSPPTKWVHFLFPLYIKSIRVSYSGRSTFIYGKPYVYILYTSCDMSLRDFFCLVIFRNADRTKRSSFRFPTIDANDP